jgi:hypothetical protein
VRGTMAVATEKECHVGMGRMPLDTLDEITSCNVWLSQLGVKFATGQVYFPDGEGGSKEKRERTRSRRMSPKEGSQRLDRRPANAWSRA